MEATHLERSRSQVVLSSQFTDRGQIFERHLDSCP